MISAILWDIEPRLFAQFEFFRWYGICWAVGMILSYQLVKYIYRKEAQSEKELDQLVSYLIVGIIVGARLGHILFYDPMYYFKHPIEILPIRLEPQFEFTGLSGLASHGGIVGALLALYLFQRKYRTDSLWTLDRLVIGGSLLGGFIRLGNLMNSEIIGTPTDLPWAFVFAQVDTIPRHPAQLYEALFYFLTAFLLFSIWKSKRMMHSKGFLFGLCIALIFLQRFFVEFVKENQVSFEDGLLLNMGQILSIPLVLVGVGLMVRSIRTLKAIR